MLNMNTCLYVFINTNLENSIEVDIDLEKIIGAITHPVDLKS